MAAASTPAWQVPRPFHVGQVCLEIANDDIGGTDVDLEADEFGASEARDDDEAAAASGGPLQGCGRRGDLVAEIVGQVDAEAGRQAVLEGLPRGWRERRSRLRLGLAYPSYEPLRRLLDQAGAAVLEQDFGAEVTLLVELPEDGVAGLLAAFEELTAGRGRWEAENQKR